jgi:putative hydrolase of the HAD superfamily
MLDIRVLLFDMGGVLVELRGVEVMLEWLDNTLTADELLAQMAAPEPVRKFETGRIGAESLRRA